VDEARGDEKDEQSGKANHSRMDGCLKGVSVSNSIRIQGFGLQLRTMILSVREKYYVNTD